MVVAFGLEENKLATKLFIDIAPVTLTLTPRALVDDGEGGKRKVAQTPRAPQVFTLIEPSNSGQTAMVTTDDGSQDTLEFLLLGEFDAIIGKDDVFTFEGREYKVEIIMPFNGYERRAGVLRHGW